MRKVLITLLMLASCIMTDAQNTGFSKPAADNPSEEQRPRKGLFEKKAKTPIDKKYLAGACPEENGKIVWRRHYNVDGKNARQIYDIMLAFLKNMAKEEGQSPNSQVAVVNESMNQIGACYSENMIFENRPLSLDQADFIYQIIVNCTDGGCEVIMRNMKYTYEADRPGGGTCAAEELISDKNAINKKGNGFQKGGVRKFRTKTIDRKDDIFAKIDQALK